MPASKPTWQLAPPSSVSPALERFLSSVRRALKAMTSSAAIQKFSHHIAAHTRPASPFYRRTHATRFNKPRRRQPFDPFPDTPTSLAYHYDTFFDPLNYRA